MSHVKKFYDPDAPMWIIGCIDAYGAIHARAAKSGGRVMHGPAESKGKRWRWNIWVQEFVATRNPANDLLSEDERVAVCDWLEIRGYKK